MSQERPLKRRRVSDAMARNDRSSTNSDAGSNTESKVESSSTANETRLNSLSRAVTPPLGIASIRTTTSPTFNVNSGAQLSAAQEQKAEQEERLPETTSLSDTQVVPSPICLTRIRDLPGESNIDVVTLADIFGDPMIKEAWIFNYLHDVSFIMSHLDPDVRDTVQVKIIHGSWKREDSHRMSVEEDAKGYKNVQVIIAHMPEMFGTHHSKAMVLIRHDDLAQVVIHTANMIQQDWANLTQAVWRSPLLPICENDQVDSIDAPIGSGRRFKIDFLNYLRAYQGRTKPLVEQLRKYDFSAIRAALIASVPCKQSIESVDAKDTRFGWSGMRHILKAVPARRDTSDNSPPQLVTQISSVGNLGAKDKWFDPFMRTLAVTAESVPTNGISLKPQGLVKPVNHTIFPTTDEVRRSLDGYASGASIHMKLENKAMQTQLAYMRPMLRHWAGEASDPPAGTADNSEEMAVRQALRRRAAPHIKTYIRFSNARMDKIDWAMVTSANLSKQAWGEAAKEGSHGREVRIASYELGVVLWPALFEDGFGTPAQDAKQRAAMVPVFRANQPSQTQLAAVGDGVGKVVGFRMPYDLPLVPYVKAELPWCATAKHGEPDWKGVVWEGYSRRA